MRRSRGHGNAQCSSGGGDVGGARVAKADVSQKSLGHTFVQTLEQLIERQRRPPSLITRQRRGRGRRSRSLEGIRVVQLPQVQRRQWQRRRRRRRRGNAEYGVS